VDPDDGVEILLLMEKSMASRTMPALLTRMSRRPKSSTVLLDEGLGPGPVGHVGVVGRGMAAVLADDLGHLFGRGLVLAPAVDRAAERR